MNNLRVQIAEKAAELAKDAMRSAANAKEASMDAWETVQDKAAQPIQTASECLREHSAGVALAALGCGVLLGLYLNRPEPPSLMENGNQGSQFGR